MTGRRIPKLPLCTLHISPLNESPAIVAGFLYVYTDAEHFLTEPGTGIGALVKPTSVDPNKIRTSTRRASMTRTALLVEHAFISDPEYGTNSVGAAALITSDRGPVYPLTVQLAPRSEPIGASHRQPITAASPSRTVRIQPVKLQPSTLPGDSHASLSEISHHIIHIDRGRRFRPCRNDRNADTPGLVTAL